MFGLHGKLTAQEGRQDELATILIEASQIVKKLNGCRLYIISKTADNPSEVWITEAWDSKDDHQNSLKDENVRALISKAIPILAFPPTQGQVLDVLGGHGV